MDALIPKLQTKTLRRAPDPNAYKLYRAALECDLVDPILIKDRKDLKSEPRWREYVLSYYYQITNLITFCRRLPVTLLADDVGLGKTISAGLIASELMSRNRISKILVVCPKIADTTMERRTRKQIRHLWRHGYRKKPCRRLLAL
jgi:hypothetical protein